jgi:UDP-N-acetylglucosamine 2-epimerase (non-hydrolysing)
MKISVVVGTRPEIIKMAPVIRALQGYPEVDLLFIHSGQHYDKLMSDVFLREFKLPEPINLGVRSGSHGEQTAKVLIKCERIFERWRPDLVLSEGDTNTAFASALASVKMHIPYGHVEAGLRCFDEKMPEEVNRVLADHCATLCFAPTERAALNLVFEGIMPSKIFITGNPIVDAVTQCLRIAKTRKSCLDKLGVSHDEKIILLTLHRAENTDNAVRLQKILTGVSKICGGKVIFPMHPRTRKVIEASYKLLEYLKRPNIISIEPLGYFDFIFLLSKSQVVLTDSGGVQEEAITLGVPCLTLRYSTERPETIEARANVLVDDDPDAIFKLTEKILGDKNLRNRMIPTKNPFGDGHAGERIAEICVKKFGSGDLRYHTPIFLKRGSGSYLLAEGGAKKEGTRLLCYFTPDGRPVFPSDNVSPERGWKALVLEGD